MSSINPRRITACFENKCVDVFFFLRNVRVYAEMYAGILVFIVKLPDDAWANHS